MQRQLAATIVALIIGSIGLTACQNNHNNKLLTANRDQVIQFINDAERYALKNPVFGGAPGLYEKCLTNSPALMDFKIFEPSLKDPCKLYLQEMLKYAKQTKNFNGLTMADLKDEAVLLRTRNGELS